jgi:hypothetical protein
MMRHQEGCDRSVPGGPVPVEVRARPKRRRKRKADEFGRKRDNKKARAWANLLRMAVKDARDAGAPLPDVSPADVLAWADAYNARTGQWPTQLSGPIPEAPGETWLTVQAALFLGERGMEGRTTLLRFLTEHWVRFSEDPPEFTVDEILAWADAYQQPSGRRPITTSGEIPGTDGITWKKVDEALRAGRTDRPAGLSLSSLLTGMRGYYRHADRPPLTENQILAWADAHHQRTGSWPTKESGWVGGAPGEAWHYIEDALLRGTRGLAGGSSLPRLLAARRGVRNRKALPPWDLERILSWADAHHARSGRWPHYKSGPIPEAPGETWQGVESGLWEGIRGLPGGSSLAQLLAERRGVRNPARLPPLSVEQVLTWVDAFRARTGRWPTRESGAIAEAPGECWMAVDRAMYKGHRGFSGGSSLARLLAQERGVRNIGGLPPLSIPEILRWADAHRDRHGTWPTCQSGPIPEAPGEIWMNVHTALQQGRRGLSGVSSLAQLLAAQRGLRNQAALPPLTVEQILAWADAHHARTGRWPTERSGPIPEAPGETWMGIRSALSGGNRGLPDGSSLARLLSRERGVRNHTNLPPLKIRQILRWADAHRKRHGTWPNNRSGPIPEATGETWSGVENALSRGQRGLVGGSSLARLFAAKRGTRNAKGLPPLTLDRILAWADAHHARAGRWPQIRSGPVPEAPGETWSAINGALSQGCRGLPAGSTLARLLSRERGVVPASCCRRASETVVHDHGALGADSQPAKADGPLAPSLARTASPTKSSRPAH